MRELLRSVLLSVIVFGGLSLSNATADECGGNYCTDEYCDFVCVRSGYGGGFMYDCVRYDLCPDNNNPYYYPVCWCY